MILTKIIIYSVVLILLYFVVLFIGIYIVPYLGVGFCKKFYRLFPVTSILILGFSVANNQYNIQKLEKLKKIDKEVTKYDLARKRLKRINKLKK
jgi:hypothetical protein